MTDLRWTQEAVEEALKVRAMGDASGSFPNVSTDTRTLGSGDLFVALTGDRFDGHDFLGQAIEAGCGGVVVSSDRVDAVSSGVPVFAVPDTLRAYGDLALHKRRCSEATVVAITGSSGKTTVKDLTTAAVSASKSVHATQGNFNNRIGLPATILNASATAQVWVLEMGTNEPGEIGELTRIAEPDVGLVTTVSETHVEKLRDLDGVLEEKLSLLSGLGADATALVGDTPASLPEGALKVRPNAGVVGFSSLASEELRGADLSAGADGVYSFRFGEIPVEPRIPGRHGAYNALLAMAIASSVGVDLNAAANALSRVQPSSMRGERKRVGPFDLIVDCYNANPQSVVAGVATLNEAHARGRRIAVVGSMLELGELSDELHDRVLSEVLATDVDGVIAVGAFANTPTSDPRILGRVAELSDNEPQVLDLLLPGDLVLLKASRGVRLERVLTALESRYSGEND